MKEERRVAALLFHAIFACLGPAAVVVEKSRPPQR